MIFFIYVFLTRQLFCIIEHHGMLLVLNNFLKILLKPCMTYAKMTSIQDFISSQLKYTQLHTYRRKFITFCNTNLSKSFGRSIVWCLKRKRAIEVCRLLKKIFVTQPCFYFLLAHVLIYIPLDGNYEIREHVRCRW